MKKYDAAGRLNAGGRFQNSHWRVTAAGQQRGYFLGKFRGVNPVDSHREEQWSRESKSDFPALHRSLGGMRKRRGRIVCFRFAAEAEQGRGAWQSFRNLN